MPSRAAPSRARATPTASRAPARAKQAAGKTTAKKRTSKKRTSKKRTSAKKAATKKTATRKTTKKTATKKTATKKTAARQAAKKTAKKTARKAPAGKFPFPFFGAGLASYFEWGGLYVWFEEPPPKSARAKLRGKIPEPFRGDAEWGGPVLHATSGDQFINMHICSAYARLGDPHGEPDDDDDIDGLEFGVGEPFPNRKQARAFEADIDAWLLALHRKHRIAFVARREDSEAGGTKLGAWHRWSMTRFLDVVLPLWQAHHRKPPHRLVEWALHEALQLALDSPLADKLPAAVRTWYAKDDR